MSDNILKLEQVSYRYPDGTVALTNCSLAVQRNTRTAVLGVNGAGKTTMFQHLNGILRPASGRILYDNIPLDYSRSGMHRLRSRVGMVFQNPDNQLFSASVREDISFGPMNMGLPETEVRQLVENALLTAGITEIADKPVHNLSYGQKKRVCIAGVLAMRPEVMVLDEPMAGLDASMQEELTATLDILHSAGMTIVIATHDLDFAYGWADELLVLQEGQLLTHGPPHDILNRRDILEKLGSAPLVNEITRALYLLGVDLRDNGNEPRSKKQLLTALSNYAGQERTP